MKLGKFFEAAVVMTAGIVLGSVTQVNYQRQQQTQQAALACPTLAVTPQVVYRILTATVVVPPSITPEPSTSTAVVAPPSITPPPTLPQAVNVATLAPATVGPSATSSVRDHATVSPHVSAEVANDGVNVRAQPGREAERRTQLARGAAVSIFEREIVGGETWAHVTYSGGDGWILESLLAAPGSAASAPRPTFTSAPAAGGSGTTGGLGLAPGFRCPSNCDGAVAMGLSAEQAAACGLDRDGDGVACYGD